MFMQLRRSAFENPNLSSKKPFRDGPAKSTLQLIRNKFSRFLVTASLLTALGPGATGCVTLIGGSTYGNSEDFKKLDTGEKAGVICGMVAADVLIYVGIYFISELADGKGKTTRSSPPSCTNPPCGDPTFMQDQQRDSNILRSTVPQPAPPKR